MSKILGIGNALVDNEYLLTDQQLTATGLTKGNMTLASGDEQQALINALTTQSIKPAHRASGGSGANSIFAIASLAGHSKKTAYLCRVGDDEAGKFYLNDLNQGGVTTLSTATAKGETTGSCMVLVTPDGERTMQTFLGTSAEIDDSNIDFNDPILTGFGTGDWLYIEGYLAFNPTVQSALGQLKTFAREKGMKIAVSFADPAVVKFGREGIDSMLAGGVDAVFCNCEEAMIFTNQSEHKSATQDLLKVTKLAVVTNGAEGALVATSDDIIKIATPNVEKVVDTNGAGDNFAGAFLYGLSQGYALEKCGELASQVASQVVQNFGARLAVSDYQAIAKNITH